MLSHSTRSSPDLESVTDEITTLIHNQLCWKTRLAEAMIMCTLCTVGAVGAICGLAVVQAAAEEPSSVRRTAAAGSLGQPAR